MNAGKVIQPGGGQAGILADGLGVVFKLDSADSGGRFSIVEHPFEVGTLVRPHMHSREDESSIVLEGQIGFRSENREVVLSPGGYIVKPRGEIHAMWNAGSSPARMIEIITPGGLEEFFRELVRVYSAGPVDRITVDAIADRYGLVFAEPDWLADVTARYGLPTPHR